MGSGVSRNYSDTTPQSQPFADSYSVTNDLLNKDKKDSEIFDSEKGYFKNPTASNLMESIIGDGIYICGVKAHGQMIYVMNENGDIIFGKRFNPNNINKRSPHPTLIGGKNPKVICAGMITFRKGKIVSLDNNSGHYKPNIRSMETVNDFMSKLYETNPNVFSNESMWRKNDGNRRNNK